MCFQYQIFKHFLLVSAAVKFNIKNQGAIPPPVPLNGGLFGLSAKQKKRRRNKMMKALKKQQETVKTEDLANNTCTPPPTVATPIKFTPAKFIPKPLLAPSPLFTANNVSPTPQNKTPSPVKEEVKFEPTHVPSKSPVDEPANLSSIPSANQSQNDDYLAQINTAQSSLDMSEWPASLM